MDDFELKKHLRAIPPAAAPKELEERIATDLAAAMLAVREPRTLTAGTIERPVRNPWAGLLRHLLSATCGALAAVAAMLALRQPVAPHQEPVLVTAATPGLAEPDAQKASVFEPAALSREVVATVEADAAADSEADLDQLRLYSSVERYVWRNATTGAELAVEVPREDLVVTSTSFQ